MAPCPLSNRTVPPAPIEKLRQLTMAVGEDWVIVSELAPVEPITAFPEATVPPVGSTAPTCAEAEDAATIAVAQPNSREARSRAAEEWPASAAHG